jgi:glycosyltransferase involved in cell wall biosynthesis
MSIELEAQTGRLTILFVLHYAGVYGANLSMLSTAEALRQHHGIHPVFLVPANGPVLGRLEQQGFSFLVIQARGAVNDGSRWSRAKALGRLAYNVRQARLAACQLRPLAVDLVYVNSLTNQMGLLLARLLQKPFVVHLREYGWEDYGFRHDFDTSLLPCLLARSSQTICISSDLQQHHLSQFPSTRPDRTAVIYNGIGSAREFEEAFRVRAQHLSSTKSDRVEVGLVGYIAPTKGHETGLRAFAQLISQGLNMRLNVFGEGPDTEVHRLKTLAHQLGVSDRVIFRGHMDDTEQIYSELHVLLMCSKREAMGRVTVEAMSRGVLVVGHSAGATQEIISHGMNGFLYEGFENADGLAKAMLDAMNPATGERIRIRAHQDALKRFTTEINGQQIHAVIRDALAAALSP